MMNHIKKIVWASAAAGAAYVLLSAATAFAAAVNVTLNENVVTQGQATQVNVQLDTQGASANTIQGEVTFPPGLFRLEKVSDGSSVASLWIDPPAESAPGVVDFAGIMPGGFSGSDGPLFSLLLMPLMPGTGTIQVATATVLANDGMGSSLPVTLSAVSVNVGPANASSGPSFTTPPIIDYAAPNPFTPQVVSSPTIFNGKYFLVFSTTDSGSGIDHYEVLEVPSGGSQQPFSSWHVATSPYLLTDQTLSSDIYVRAVDHDGNFIVVKVPAEHPYAAREDDWEFIVAAILIGALVLLLLIWRHHRRAHIEP